MQIPYLAPSDKKPLERCLSDFQGGAKATTKAQWRPGILLEVFWLKRWKITKIFLSKNPWGRVIFFHQTTLTTRMEQQTLRIWIFDELFLCLIRICLEIFRNACLSWRKNLRESLETVRFHSGLIYIDMRHAIHAKPPGHIRQYPTKREEKIILPATLKGNMLVPWRVATCMKENFIEQKENC